MPKLDGKSYGYNKAGYAAYMKALKKKRKKLRENSEDGDQYVKHQFVPPGGDGGGG